MNFQELLAELPKLTPSERAKISERVTELEESNADRVAGARTQELSGGTVQPKTQTEVFHNARAALK